MLVQPIQTDKVRPGEESLTVFLDRSLSSMHEDSILAITSKIVALSEGSFISKGNGLREEVVVAEADYYLPKEESPYDIPLTIRDNAFVARAGIDGSNTDGVYSLLPVDSYRTARETRDYLMQRFMLKRIGVIITDSHSTPLRRGVTGIAIGWSGFVGLKEYKDTPDIFGHRFTTHTNIVDALATAAVLTMGEGAEQTPLATIADIPFVEFNAKSPTVAELAFFKPTLEDDLFAPLIDYRKLRKGHGR
ncbi:MAG: coenzyme F420-0:L-glutamate ligase [Candidatus Moraniibacteriota bacterium]